MSYKCKECGAEFESEKGLHGHLKAHKMYVADYYVKHYPRFNKLNGNPLPFKKKEEYFENDFINRSQLIKWCEQADPSEVKKYVIELLQRRVAAKGYKHACSHLELENRQLPSVDIFKQHFGTFSNACKEAGVLPMFSRGMPKSFYEDVDVEVLVDTREQKPLSFPRERILKLDFGDYTLSGDDFANTFVDRKSAGDFLSTFGGQLDRFRREMKRCQEVDGYMYIVVEKTIPAIKKEAAFKGRRGQRAPKTEWVMSNMFAIQHEFPNNCQFIFTKNRKQSEEIVPKLLKLGPKLWDVDVQYFLDKEDS